MRHRAFFSELLPVLAERSKLAAISRLGFSNVPLRRHLGRIFDEPFGTTGSFLADPTFETVFGWRPGPTPMQDLAGSLLSPDLIEAMDQPPKELAAEYRFPRDLHPYTHQLEAWRRLAQQPPQSLIIASGTGSGKTECFMVPVVDRMIRERERIQGQLIGVRALFLYPLNALINSQRERLRAWTHRFGSDIRFCLYNGNTPERPDRMRVEREHSNEVRDRQTLRREPPPILVTNPTMLEYMLVRTVDRPILEHSQGKLQWVVLDEAHTYVGSQAAEAALLLRRVLIAFGVEPSQVHFVATSATIGDPQGEAGKQLQKFLADVAGVDPANVHLVAGERRVPELSQVHATASKSLDALAAIDPSAETSRARYDALVGDPKARAIRGFFVEDPKRPPIARLSDICRMVYGRVPGRYTQEQQRGALEWLDLLSGTRDTRDHGRHDGESFLPLRAHLFHQTLSGLWACADAECPEKPGSELDDPAWHFGRIYLEPHKHCSCGSPAYEVVTCGDCGTVYLQAGLDRPTGLAAGRLTHLQPVHALDEFELDIERDSANESMGDGDDNVEAETDEPSGGLQTRVLILPGGMACGEAMYLDPKSREVRERTSATLGLRALEESMGLLECPSCSGIHNSRAPLLVSSRLGAPFLLGGILPSLLEYAPDGDKPGDHPCRGRRLLTFSDSRQGTARLATKLQQDAERNRVRALVYHLVLQRHLDAGNQPSTENQQAIAKWEAVLANIHDPTHREPVLEQIKRLKGGRDREPEAMEFNDLIEKLANSGKDFSHMLRHYQRNAPETFEDSTGTTQLARLFLVREFGRRPKRLNNLESMGLVHVRYPAIDRIQAVNTFAQNCADWELRTWRDWLKISLDFYVRASGAVEISPQWRRWLGIPFPQKRLVSYDYPSATGRTQQQWPRVEPTRLNATLVRLLAACLHPAGENGALKDFVASPEGQDRIDGILRSTWETLTSRSILKLTDDGYVLPMDRMAFAPMDRAWVCPVTRSFLDTTLTGLTPYLPRLPTSATARCELVDLPLYPKPFANAIDDLERIRSGRQWLLSQEKIQSLREQGLWSDVNDRTIELSAYFTAAEHSAQQDSKTLQRYEKEFKDGDLNLLSCSTTMEMGIDIGGMSMVAMNNVPPHPANYLQRAGRAGRRREARSLSMTLCKGNPHDQAVFRDTRWAFNKVLPAPRVALDSPIIVQRHVQSWLLSCFLEEKLAHSDQEQLKLTCGSFFLENPSLASGFQDWCRCVEKVQRLDIDLAIRRLTRFSALEGRQPERIAVDAADRMSKIAQGWKSEWDNLKAEEEALTQGGGARGPAQRAVSYQRQRLEEEYLLRELSTRGYLPAYGFPTHIAPFDNLTVSRFKRERRQAGHMEQREDNRYRRRELANRDLTTALREYAPGSQVVIDGLVYRSEGVTLNWHIPANQEDVREIQQIRHAWRCRNCGASGSSASQESARHCDACGSDVALGDTQEYLEPSGFAVDFYKDPDNDVSRQTFVPVKTPWIHVRGHWFPLDNPALGRLRSSTDGHVFHQSRGAHGQGYVLCLECGRAEPIRLDGSSPELADPSKPHRKLRRGREDGAVCPGSRDPWKIKVGLSLGHEARTDVLEIQLKTDQGAWLNDPTAARTLAVAVRDALAETLGVQATELGCDIKPSQSGSGTPCQSILIHDRNAAGYASSAPAVLLDCFNRAHARLQCPAACDSVCPQCVLDFDQRFAADHLDRHRALNVLSQSWLSQFRLPEEYAFFGPASRAEPRRFAESLWHAVHNQTANAVRLYTGGDAEHWDIGLSPLRNLAYRLAGNDVPVEIVVPGAVLDKLDDTNRFLLASLADHSHIQVLLSQTVMPAGPGWLLAEVRSGLSQRWAVRNPTQLTFGADWGDSDDLLVTSLFSQSDCEGAWAELAASKIRPQAVDRSDRDLEIRRELNGPFAEFGRRFWSYLAREHAGTQQLLKAENDQPLQIRYQDRYLFSPLSIALLFKVLEGLRDHLGEARWPPTDIEIVTLANKEPKAAVAHGHKRLWGDWSDMQLRDAVLKRLFEQSGLPLTLTSVDKKTAGHGRLLEVVWRSQATLTIRLDQGVSYWRAGRGKSVRDVEFNLETPDIDRAADQLLNLRIPVEGADHSTQIFVKRR